MSTPRSAHADLVLRVASHRSASPAAELLPAVDSSWRRCVTQFHLDPARSYEPVVLQSSRLRELCEEHADLIHIARAEMDLLYEQISASGHALLLADTHGVILSGRVDPTIKKSFEHAGLIVGAEWSEEREGTNGIGTCVTERRAITIHQTDHFRSRHIGLSCSAAPIRDAFGNVIAVLDASSCTAPGSREQQSHTVALVNASARLIEKCMFLRRYRGETVLRFHYRPEFVDQLHDGAIAVGADGTIVAADMTGVRLLGAGDYSALVGRPFSEVFNARCEDLQQRTAQSAHRSVWELRDRTHGNCFFASFAAVSDPIERLRPPGATAKPTKVQIRPQPTAPEPRTLEALAGEDPHMIRNVYHARRVLNSSIAVLLSGPTGCGKEEFARAMHLASERAAAPFVALNCAAIPEQLIESELFGYSAGAFTGARREGMRGCITRASGGTLFLDEIGDMPLPLQTRLLRVLEDQRVQPLGAEAPVKLDLHVVSATHCDLRAMVREGRFREDLYYRLNGIQLPLPPLAARRDREALIRSCLAREAVGGPPAAIELEALGLLSSYGWPGNIRELRNAVRTALAICENRVIRADDLPPAVREQGPAESAGPAACGDDAHARAALRRQGPLEHAERQALLKTIERNEWNMSRTAAELGLSRSTLYRKLRHHHIPVGRAHLMP
jgi:transcriptional regulator of acetoin/glycerol metabolism